MHPRGTWRRARRDGAGPQPARPVPPVTAVVKPVVSATSARSIRRPVRRSTWHEAAKRPMKPTDVRGAADLRAPLPPLRAATRTSDHALNDQFVSHPGPALALNYYITNVLAIGVNGNLLRASTRLGASTSRRAARPASRAAHRVPVERAALNFTYVPVYGKFAGLRRLHLPLRLRTSSAASARSRRGRSPSSTPTTATSTSSRRSRSTSASVSASSSTAGSRRCSRSATTSSSRSSRTRRSTASSTTRRDKSHVVLPLGEADEQRSGAARRLHLPPVLLGVPVAEVTGIMRTLTTKEAMMRRILTVLAVAFGLMFVRQPAPRRKRSSSPGRSRARPPSASCACIARVASRSLRRSRSRCSTSTSARSSSARGSTTTSPTGSRSASGARSAPSRLRPRSPIRSKRRRARGTRTRAAR